jgi:ribosome biogenesis protein NSA2
MPHTISKQAEKLRGIKAKIFNKKRFVEKIKMRKT